MLLCRDITGLGWDWGLGFRVSGLLFGGRDKIIFYGIVGIIQGPNVTKNKLQAHP